MAHALPRVAPIQRPIGGELVIFLLFLLVTVGLHPFSPIMTAQLTGDGTIGRQATYLLVFVTAALALRPFGDVRRLLPFPAAMILLLGWCCLSVLWAVEPAIALRRLVLTGLLIWAIFLAVEQTGFQQTTKVLRIVLLITLALNYLAVLMTPNGVHVAADPLELNLAGDWRGVLQHKNFAGPVCAVTILLLVFVRDNMGLRWRLAIIAATGYFLYRTVSKTSMALLFLALLCGWIYSAISARQRPFLIPVVALAGVVLIYAALPYASASYYSPDTLTGRVQIWPVLWAYAREHLWFGAGFGSFWDIGPASPVYRYNRGWVASLASGHNGYLDLLTQIGLPGLALAVFALVAAPAWALLSNTQVAPRQGAFLVASLVFCVGHNFTESTLLNRDAFLQVFLMFTLALTTNAVRRVPMPADRRMVPKRPQPARNTGSLQHNMPI